jgi:hypothetical protein
MPDYTIVMFRRCLFFIALPIAAPLHGQNGAAARAAAATITESDIARRVWVIAHDSMRGRDTPSRELDLVAAHIAAEFRRFGLVPGGDSGGFIQHYQIQRVRLDTAVSRIAIEGGPTLRFGPDVVRWRGSFTTPGASGETVLVTGVPGAAAGVDALDLSGKVVLMVPRTEATGQPLRDADRLMRALSGRGPVAVIAVVDAPDETWGELGRGQRSQSVGVTWGGDDAVVVLAREGALASTLERAGLRPSALRADAGPLRAQPVPGLRLRVSLVPHVLEARRAPNVVGILRGGDPRLRDEYLVFSAHMDHVGTAGTGRCRPQGADSICNGADDDASGTVSVVELAEAFSRLTPRPRRSLIFLTVSGEERGLWGSDYFAGHPPVPVERLVADLNLDMVGRNWKDTISVIGKEHSDLGATLARVNAAHPELDMEAVGDLWPAENFYFRSDHYNFARRGVPVLFFFNGTHADYHRPSDHPDKIDAEKQARLTRLVFYLGLEIANAAERPRWNPDSYREIVTER